MPGFDLDWTPSLISVVVALWFALNLAFVGIRVAVTRHRGPRRLPSTTHIRRRRSRRPAPQPS